MLLNSPRRPFFSARVFFPELGVTSLKDRVVGARNQMALQITKYKWPYKWLTNGITIYLLSVDPTT